MSLESHSNEKFNTTIQKRGPVRIRGNHVAVTEKNMTPQGKNLGGMQSFTCVQVFM